MPDEIKHNKSIVIGTIKKNITTLNAVVLLIVFILFFLNVRLLYETLNYIPSVSIAAMVTIIAGLVLISLYLAKVISRNAIKELEVYDIRLNNTLNSYQEEILERKQSEKKLERLVFMDQLTNLPNRNLFTKRLSRLVERKKQYDGYTFAVLFIDLDNFKVVNDSLGHLVGNQLLVSVARRLENCVRSIDTIARFGGDEFAILLDNINDMSDSIRVAKRIQKELKQSFNLNGYNVFTSASIGIALSTTDYKKQEDLIRDADIAMYRAKTNGRAQYAVYDDGMHNIIMKRLKLEVELRKAVEIKEFMVYYQPIVSVTDGSIVGSEALIRWKHPQLGLIPPAEFIPLAEDIRLIESIGQFVLRTACAQNRAWHNAGYKQLYISVNFSSVQFHNQNIPALIRGVLKETNMDAELLDIEITESIAMQDHSIKVLNELSAMGIKTSIDDFGTGHSSLGTLKKFPINALKIDRSFIKDIARDPDAETILKAIIAMAHALKIKVVAEGVETKEHLSILKSDLCDEIQGYFYSPPLPAKEFTDFLQKGHI